VTALAVTSGAAALTCANTFPAAPLPGNGATSCVVITGVRCSIPGMASDPVPAERPNAAQRLAAALGRPAPRPLSAAERADLERRQDAADAELERIYGLGQTRAA